MVDENTQGEGADFPSPKEWLAQKRAEAAQQPQEQAPASDSGSDEGGRGVMGTVGDVARGAVDGLQEGVSEAVETVGWAGDEAMFNLSGFLTGTEQNYYPGEGWVTRDDVEAADAAGEDLGWQPLRSLDEATDVEQAETTAGNLTAGVTQFLAGYGAAGRALKGWKATTRGGQLGKEIAKGAGGDFMSFDAHEERFSDFLRDNFAFRDDITEFLAADEDDSVLMGKLKNTLEGAGMGVATDGVIQLVKLFKRARRVRAEQGDEAAAEVMNEGVEEIEEAQQLSLFDETTDPNLAVADDATPDVRVNGQKKPAKDRPAPEEAPRDGVSPSTMTAQQRLKAAQDRPELDTSKFQRAIDLELGLTRGGAAAVEGQNVGFDYFNWDKMDTDSSTKDFLRMAIDAIPEGAIQKSKTFSQMESEAVDFLADSIDGSPRDVRAYLRSAASQAQDQQAALLGGKMLFQSLNREIEQLAYKISSGTAVDMDYSKMVRLQSSAMEIVADVKTLQKSAAQTTAAGRIHTTDAITGDEIKWMDIEKQLDESLSTAGGRENIKQLADEIMAQKKAGGGRGNALTVTANRAKSRTRKFWDVVNEVRINGLLSGPTTHAINIMSNALQTALLPAEKMAGGAVVGDMKLFREGVAQYVGVVQALREATRYAALAGWKGRNLLDPEAAILEANGVDFRAIKSNSNNRAVRTSVNALGTAVRLPSRGLTAGDEFFKQLNYRSNIYARATRQAADMVAEGRMSKEEASRWVKNRVDASVGKDGRARDKSGLNHAREATFTDPLKPGSFSKRMQDASNAHGLAKVILPFVRTPTNIIVAAAQRTPALQFASKRFRDDLMSADPSRRAAARGKMVTSKLVWGAAITAAMEGKITGGGPVDPEARRALMETGWRPYSYVRKKSDGGAEYVEYRRADPFAMFLGIAADVAEIGGQADEVDMEEIAKASLVSVMNNLGSKTYLQGITDLASAISSSQMYGRSYLNSLATSFLPYSSALRTARKANDPVMREARTVLDSVRNTIPGYSKDLPARRSMYTGKPIVYPKGWGDDMVTPLGEAMASGNPIYATDWKQDPVLDELARLGDGIPGYPSRKIKGVELTTEQYSTYVGLIGQVRNPRTKRTLHQELERRFAMPIYDVDRQRAGDSSDPGLNPRVKMVRDVVFDYKRAARDEMMQRYPQLAQDILDVEAQARNNARALTTGVTELGE